MEIDYFSSFLIESPSQSLYNVDNFTSTNNEVTSLVQSIPVEDTTKRQKLKPQRKKKGIANTDLSNGFLCGYKLKVMCGGYFRTMKSVKKKKYCSGKQKTIYLDLVTSNFGELFEEITALYNWEESHTLFMFFLDKDADCQSFIQLQDDSSYQVMVSLYKDKDDLVIYVVTDINRDFFCDTQGVNLEENARVTEIPEIEDELDGNYEEGSDYCASEESYHSLYSSDDNDSRDDSDRDEELCSHDKDKPVMKVGAQFPDVAAFRVALNHHALTTDFEYDSQKSDPTRVIAKCKSKDCTWRIHATVSSDDGVTFIVRSLQPDHKCFGVNKLGNKHATVGWIADRVVNDLRRDGNISPNILKKNLESAFGIKIPYLKVWRGKELAMEQIYGKWDDSFIQIGAFKEEILKRDPDSIIILETEPLKSKRSKAKREEPVKESRHFQRFFISFGACRIGFLTGCRPYIGLDACHLKGKWNGVLAAATAVDGNNMMFPVAFAVMENESESSWEWFLRSLYQAIGMPKDLVISSGMQKGLLQALPKVYPLAKHRECMRHLYKNFKKYYSGDILKAALWIAARTYSPIRYQRIIAAIDEACPASMKFLRDEHYKLWSRSQFGTMVKCDYITNNISETFNSWITEERKTLVLNLLDSIRQKIMVKFNERRRVARSWKGPLVPKVQEYIRYISRGLNEYVVLPSMDHFAEVLRNERRWEVNLEERKCTCRAWQVKGVPCVHAAAVIASIRNAKWEDYVDSYFTVDRFKTAYAIGVPSMPSRHEWSNCDLGYNMLPPIIRRPSGRPRKNRIKPSCGEKKRSNKCSRCGMQGHHKNTCKNDVSLDQDEGASETMQSAQRSKRKVKAKTRKWTCSENLLKLIQQKEI